MFVVCTSSGLFRRIFSVTLNSSLERKSAAVLTEPAICAILKLNCNTYCHALHKNGGIVFFRKKRGIDLLSVKTIVGFDASHKMCANSRNVM